MEFSEPLRLELPKIQIFLTGNPRKNSLLDMGAGVGGEIGIWGLVGWPQDFWDFVGKGFGIVAVPSLELSKADLEQRGNVGIGTG